jgi:3-oxoacyl-[acyl-carrier protein] reductase
MSKVLVTGASKGIGRELVLQFTKLNHEVLAISRDATQLQLLQKQSQCSIFPADLMEINFQTNNSGLFKKLEDFGPIDILINNAGLLHRGLFSDFPEAQAHAIFEVNFFKPVSLIRALLPFFQKESLVHIVNISSMGGYQGSAKFPGLSYYSASKAALSVMTECLAEEFKQTNLRFNSLNLGSVQTEMLAEAFPGYQAQTQPDQMAAWIVNFALTSGHLFNGKIIPVAGLSV